MFFFVSFFKKFFAKAPDKLETFLREYIQSQLLHFNHFQMIIFINDQSSSTLAVFFFPFLISVIHVFS